MESENYYRLKDKVPFCAQYVFIDHETDMAEPLFKQANIRVKYKDSLARKNSSYKIHFCSLRKKDIPVFEAAMKKLKDKMYLLDMNEYFALCDELAGLLIQMVGE